MLEDPLVITLQSIAGLFIVTVTCANIFMWLNRDQMIVKYAIMPVNTLFAISCILDIVLALFTTAGEIPCIPYLYGGFLNIAMYAACYIAMAWCMIARVSVARKLLIEQAIVTTEEAKSNATITTDLELMEKNERIKNKVIESIQSRRRTWIENWMALRDWTKEPRIAVVVWFIVFSIFMIIPIILNIYEPTYQTLTGECETRTNPEVYGLVIVIVVTVTILIYILIKIWRFRSAYGEKTRLIALIFTWVILLVIAFAASSGSGWLEILEKILSVIGIIILWGIENIPPLVVITRKKIYGSDDSASFTTLNSSSSDQSASNYPTIELHESRDRSSHDSRVEEPVRDKLQTIRDVIFYDYKAKDDPVIEFGDMNGLYSTIMFIRNWNTRKGRIGKNIQLKESHAYLQYLDSIRSGCRYPIDISDDNKQDFDKLAAGYENADMDSEPSSALGIAMDNLEVTTLESLSGTFWKEYVKTKYYYDFLAKKEARETLKSV